MKFNCAVFQTPFGMRWNRFVPCNSFLTKGCEIPKLDALVINHAISWLEIDKLWKQTQGAGIKIAVLDSGVAAHDNLTGAVVEAVDFTESQFGAIDIWGHGTHVIGIIAARKRAVGISGVAPKALIYSAKVLDDSGNSQLQALIDAIDWAITRKVHLISISLQVTQHHEVLKKAIQRATEAGIFIISAVGNDGKHAVDVYPACYEQVFAVGAIKENALIAPYSNKGAYVDFVAPSKFISTYLNNQFIEWEGTSMAVAYTTGVIALFLEAYFQKNRPFLIQGQDELKKILIAACINLGTLGRNDTYGYGLINPSDLLKTMDVYPKVKN